jgi:uncharacterized membrane protein YdbT with pleckstrin-like domain
MDPSNAVTEAPEAQAVPVNLLEGDEVVLLAVKPSGWFVPLISWPVLMGAVLLGVGAIALEEFFHRGTAQPVLLICVAAACLRMMIGCFQWAGRLYVLTNKRLMRVRGILNVDVFTCPLRQISDVARTASLIENLLGVGGLHFTVSGQPSPQGSWLYVSRPAEVEEIINNALRKAL